MVAIWVYHPTQLQGNNIPRYPGIDRLSDFASGKQRI